MDAGRAGRARNAVAARGIGCAYSWALLVVAGLALLQSPLAAACDAPVSICERGSEQDFPLIRAGQPAAVFIEANADSALRHVADAFAADLQRVSGQQAARPSQLSQVRGPVVIITEAHSELLQTLAQAGRIDAAVLDGQWEAYVQQVVQQPFPGVPQALLVIGSDRRGAVFGTFDLSRRIGVSPWYWFADVPVARRESVFVMAGARVDQPEVKYRGFFINDEEPAFGSWARQHFGGINADAYQPVFELLLRLKGNLLWPAMWRPSAFFDDDPRSMVLADEMGVVIATTHHEPMMRAHDEWHRPQGGGSRGERWDYLSNEQGLREFWRGGIQRMMSKGDARGYESLVTLGMRGDGDESMDGAKAADAQALLERIVADQRRIIAEVTGKPAQDTPQVWALYKEVQDYYDQGMQVPDDVTLLFADDNWGQIRRLPVGDTRRAGGHGVYYHFDYVGGPRNYKWLNTTQIEKTWQQMDLAYQRDARALWIVNVGDIKPMEFPLSFFMDHAWQPSALGLAQLERYPEQWAADTFGDAQALAIGQLLTRYSQLAARRKPELIDADSFRLGGFDADALDGGEFAAMLAEWEQLQERMQQVQQAVPKPQHSAFFQLVEHPIRAMTTLYRLHYAVAWNRQLAAAGDERANVFADMAEVAFAEDQQITAEYHALEGGKWAGMMSQIHIGYTSWQQPKEQLMPPVQRVATQHKPEVNFKEPATAALPGVVAIEAPHYTRAVGGRNFSWRTIPHLGRTLGAVTTLPQGQGPTAQADGVRLEYDVLLQSTGELRIQLYMVPTLNTAARGGVRIGVSLDDGEMHTLTMDLEPAPEAVVTPQQRAWTQAVIDNNHLLELRLPAVTAGRHVLKLWRLDDNAVVQKLVLATVEVPQSYLGP